MCVLEGVVVLIIAWLIAPIPLGILLAIVSKKDRRKKMILYHLHSEKRIGDADLYAAGLRPPHQPGMGVQQIPAPPVQGSTEMLPPGYAPDLSMEAAAARAKEIAEAELNGEPVPVPVLPAESAAAEAITEAAETVEAAASDEAAEKSAADTAAVFAPAQAAAEIAEKTEQPAVAPDHAPVFAATAEEGSHISAISVMLSVGVALIIIAGLIFVRSQWDTMGSFGKLATLAAGSVLFFGASALANRAWNLKRTGMAFFTLGAVFLPISVWAAGYFGLLGSHLTGADNLLLIALSFASFVPIAAIAAHSYRQLGWGIAAVTGGVLAYYFAAGGLAKQISMPSRTWTPVAMAVFVMMAALPAPLLTFGAPRFRSRLRSPMDHIPVPLAGCFTGISAVLTLACFTQELSSHSLTALYACAFFLIAAALAAPVITDKIKDLIMIPVAGYTLLGLGMLMRPLYESVIRVTDAQTGEVLRENVGSFAALICAAGALLFMILHLAKLPPETIKNGVFYAAFSLSAAAGVFQLFDIAHPNAIVIAVTVILLFGWLYAAHSRPGTAVSWLIAFLSGTAALSLVELFYHKKDPCIELLLLAGAMFLLFAVFTVTKKHRCFVSDLFSVIGGVFALIAANLPLADTAEMWKWCAWGVLFATVPLYTALSLAHDTQKPEQYCFAVLSPLALFCAAASLMRVPKPAVVFGWAVISVMLGWAVYCTTKRQFHGVRRTLFCTAVLPPLAAGFFAKGLEIGKWFVLYQALCIVIAFMLWRMTANRGFKKLSAASFTALLIMAMETTFYAMRDLFFHGKSNFTVLMVTCVWILVLSLLAAAIGKRMVLFVGKDSVASVMDFAAPVCAFLLSVCLLGLRGYEWAPFCFLYTLLVCAAAWFATKRTHIATPCICMTALLVALESLRVHVNKGEDTDVALLLIGMLVLTVLFPYLGIVLRESQYAQRRSWSLTFFGGIIPLWLIAVLFDLNGITYTAEQKRWMVFFIPVMCAGYLLHFVSMTDDPRIKRIIQMVSAACGMVAFWLQPLLDVKDTYFAGKLHILPLVGFGLVIRKLYGKETGGRFLFLIGCYAMLRLGIGAAVSENPADLLTVLAVGLILFVASFYVRQKKWFLLGGISLLLTGTYMHMKLTDGRQWWVYLLLTGLVLIVVAASNETLKQRGDSLKSKAGRLWNDWTW